MQIVDELSPHRVPCSQLEPTPIDTRGFQSLLSLVGNTNNDSFDLYYGLFMYNPVSGCSLSRGTAMQGNKALLWHDPPAHNWPWRDLDGRCPLIKPGPVWVL